MDGLPPPSDFVGRPAELAVFERAIADARRGLPSVVLVSGDAGIGKTTLVSESAARAGLRAVLGRSVHIGGDTIPLAPLADLLRQIRRARPELLSHAAALTVLHDWVSPGSMEASADGASNRQLFPAVLDLLGHVGGEDTVVVGFEDLHWADTVTWDLFGYLARNLIDERVVLVGTYRANEDSIRRTHATRLNELQRLPAVQRLHLEGLNRDAIAARVTTILGATPPSTLIDQIMARGRGNPFFTNELVAAHVSGETVPLVLSDLISAEIAELDDHCRHVLSAAAAIGRASDHELLARVVHLGESEVEAALRTVIRDRLLVVDNETYRFRHPLLAEVVYADLLPPERARLHRSIAASLAQQSADMLRRADRAGELAFHLDRAGDIDGAFVALLDAADAAEAVAPGAAFSHLERAFELWQAAPAQSSQHSRANRMWQAAELASSTVGAHRAVQLAQAALAEGVPAFGLAAAHERLGRYLWIDGQLFESRVAFDRAAAELGAHDGAEAAPVFAGLAQADLMSGHYAAAQQWCEKVFDLAPTPALNVAAWVTARRVLGLVLSNLGDPTGGVTLCAEAERVKRCETDSVRVG